MSKEIEIADKVDEAIVAFQEDSGLVLNDRMTMFVKLYFGKNKKYRFNATYCAMKAYNTKNYASAAVMGSRLLKNVKALRQEVMKKQGVDYEEYLKQKWKLAKEGGYDTMKDFGASMGWDEKETDIPSNQTNIQINLSDEIDKARRQRGLDDN